MSAASNRWGWTEAARDIQSHVDGHLLNFDRVELSRAEGVESLSPAVFLTIPIDERIRLTLDRRLRFFRGQEIVPTPDAMRSLMRAAASPEASSSSRPIPGSPGSSRRGAQ